MLVTYQRSRKSRDADARGIEPAAQPLAGIPGERQARLDLAPAGRLPDQHRALGAVTGEHGRHSPLAARHRVLELRGGRCRVAPDEVSAWAIHRHAAAASATRWQDRSRGRRRRLGSPQVVGDGKTKHAPHAVVVRPGRGEGIGQGVARRVEVVDGSVVSSGARRPALARTSRPVVRWRPSGGRRAIGRIAVVERLGKLLARELEPPHPGPELVVARRQLVEGEGGAAGPDSVAAARSTSYQLSPTKSARLPLSRSHAVKSRTGAASRRRLVADPAKTAQPGSSAA